MKLLTKLFSGNLAIAKLCGGYETRLSLDRLFFFKRSTVATDGRVIARAMYPGGQEIEKPFAIEDRRVPLAASKLKLTKRELGKTDPRDERVDTLEVQFSEVDGKRFVQIGNDINGTARSIETTAATPVSSMPWPDVERMVKQYRAAEYSTVVVNLHLLLEVLQACKANFPGQKMVELKLLVEKRADGQFSEYPLRLFACSDDPGQEREFEAMVMPIKSSNQRTSGDWS